MFLMMTQLANRRPVCKLLLVVGLIKLSLAGNYKGANIFVNYATGKELRDMVPSPEDIKKIKGLREPQKDHLLATFFPKDESQHASNTQVDPKEYFKLLMLINESNVDRMKDTIIELLFTTGLHDDILLKRIMKLATKLRSCYPLGCPHEKLLFKTNNDQNFKRLVLDEQAVFSRVHEILIHRKSLILENPTLLSTPTSSKDLEERKRLTNVLQNATELPDDVCNIIIDIKSSMEQYDVQQANATCIEKLDGWSKVLERLRRDDNTCTDNINEEAQNTDGQHNH